MQFQPRNCNFCNDDIPTLLLLQINGRCFHRGCLLKSWGIGYATHCVSCKDATPNDIGLLSPNKDGLQCQKCVERLNKK